MRWTGVVLLVLSACGSKAVVLSAPADGLMFSGGSLYAAADGVAALQLNEKGKGAPVLGPPLEHMTISSDGASALGVADGVFVVVDLATGEATPRRVASREGEPFKMFRTPVGDVAVTRQVAHWRVHRWLNGADDPDPLSLTELKQILVDEGGELFYIDTGYALEVRDIRTGTLVRSLSYPGGEAAYRAVSLDAEGRLVLLVEDGEGLRLWTPPEGPSSPWNVKPGAALALSGDGGVVAVATEGAVRLLDPTGGVLREIEVEGLPKRVALSADGRFVAAAFADGRVQSWETEVQPGEPVRRKLTEIDPGRVQLSRVPLPGPEKQGMQQLKASGAPRSLVWAPDGKLHGWIGSTLTALDPFTGDEAEIRIRGLEPNKPFAWAPDGSRLAVMVSGGVSLYKPGRRWRRASSLDTGGGHAHLQWGGDVLVVDVDATQVQAWSAETGEPLGEPFKVAERVMGAFALSPDGKYLAVIGEFPQVYDVAKRRSLASLGAHIGRVASLAWSPDGERLATAGNDGVVLLWDTTTWGVVSKIEGVTGQVVTFSPDGERLLVGNYDQTVILDVSTGAGAERISLQGVSTAAWGPMGLVLIDDLDNLFVWP